MAVGSFFCLCSPVYPKHLRSSIPFYKFFYTIVSPKVSGWSLSNGEPSDFDKLPTYVLLISAVDKDCYKMC